MPLGPDIPCWQNLSNTFLLQVTLTPVNVAATTTAEQSFTVPGLITADQISDLSYIGGAFPNTLLSIANLRVSAANTLTVAFANGTAGPLAYPTGTYLIEVNRPGVSPLPSVIQ